MRMSPAEWIFAAVPVGVLGLIVLMAVPELWPDVALLGRLAGIIILTLAGIMAQIGVIAQGVKVGLDYSHAKRPR